MTPSRSTKRKRQTPYEAQEAILWEIKDILRAGGITGKITQDSIYTRHADPWLKNGPMLVAYWTPPWVPLNLRCGPRGGSAPCFELSGEAPLKTVMLFREGGSGLVLEVYLVAKNEGMPRYHYAGSAPLHVVDLAEPGSFERLEQELATWRP
jgi:hypothetical protein